MPKQNSSRNSKTPYLGQDDGKPRTNTAYGQTFSIFADTDTIQKCVNCSAGGHDANPLIVMQARYAEKWQRKAHTHEIRLCFNCFENAAKTVTGQANIITTKGKEELDRAMAEESRKRSTTGGAA